MIHSADDLRGHISRRATSLLGIIILPFASDPKIRNPGIPIFLKHNILRLQIPMNNILRMHVLQSQENTANNKS